MEQLSNCHQSHHISLFDKVSLLLSISRIYGSPGAIVTRVTRDPGLTLSPCFYQFLEFKGALEQLSPESPQTLVLQSVLAFINL